MGVTSAPRSRPVVDRFGDMGGWRCPTWCGRAAAVAGLAVTLATCRAEGDPVPLAEGAPVLIAEVEAVRILEAADSIVDSVTEYHVDCPYPYNHPRPYNPHSPSRLLSESEREARGADLETMQAEWSARRSYENEYRDPAGRYSADGWRLLDDVLDRMLDTTAVARLLDPDDELPVQFWGRERRAYEARVKASLARQWAERYAVRAAWRGGCPQPRWPKLVREDEATEALLAAVDSVLGSQPFYTEKCPPPDDWEKSPYAIHYMLDRESEEAAYDAEREARRLLYDGRIDEARTKAAEAKRLADVYAARGCG